MKRIFKFIPAITSLSLIATPTLCFVTSCGKTKTYTLKEMKVLNKNLEEEFETKLLYVKGSSIPYISLDEAFKLIKGIHAKYVSDDVFNYEITKEYGEFVVTRENTNGSKLYVNLYSQTLTFDDYTAFMCEGTAKPSSVVKDYGKFDDYKSTNINSIITYGDTDYRVKKHNTVFDLSKYNISMFQYNSEAYLPFQTMSDIFLTDPYVPLVAMKDFIFCNWGLSHDVGKEPTYPQKVLENKIEITQELLEFNYNETCFFLDSSYGLAAEKGISSFDAIFKMNGWKEQMLKSVKGFEEGLANAIAYAMDDGHSNKKYRSPMSEKTGVFEVPTGASGKWRSSEKERYQALRNQVYDPTTKPVPSYIVNDNTAVITFDKFRNSKINYYETGKLPTDPNKAEDSIGLFLSAYKDISTKTDTIKNVIVDVSCNGGGDVQSAVIIAGILAGSEVTQVFKNTVDESINVCGYYVDANLDHKIDSNDFILKDKNVYILTSTYSFSCANMLPTLTFQLPNCHVVGKRSGGGSCVVLPASSCLGTGYRMSGQMKLGYLKNGVFYYNDEGIEPEHYIDDSIYYSGTDRQDLINHIKALP